MSPLCPMTEALQFVCHNEAASGSTDFTLWESDFLWQGPYHSEDFFKCTSHVWENVQPKYFSLSHQFLGQSADRRASVQRRNSPIGGETPPPELRDQGRVVQGSWSFSCQGQTVPISPPSSTAALTTALTLCLDKG